MSKKTSVAVLLLCSVVVGRGEKATTLTPKCKGERVLLDRAVAQAVVDAGAGTYPEADDAVVGVDAGADDQSGAADAADAAADIDGAGDGTAGD